MNIIDLLQAHITSLTIHVVTLKKHDAPLAGVLKDPVIANNPDLQSHARDFIRFHKTKGNLKNFEGVLGLIAPQSKSLLSKIKAGTALKSSGKSSKKHDLILVLRPDNTAPYAPFFQADPKFLSDYKIAHYVWHILQFYNQTTQSQNGVAKTSDHGFVPNLSRMDLSKRNLRADIFASLILGHPKYNQAKYDNPAKDIARHIAAKSVSMTPGHFPELYPFISLQHIVSQSIEVYTEKWADMDDSQLIDHAKEVTHDITRICGMSCIKSWQKFCTAAQELVWNDTPTQRILGTGIDLCADPDIRMCAYSVSELLNLDIPRMTKNERWYNAFADDDVQAELYERRVYYSFDSCIENTIISGQGQAFFDLANHQNELLAKGIYFGWCAPSLQAAGQFIQNGAFQGELPKELALVSFEAERKKYTTNQLRQLGRILMLERRKGNTINTQQLHDFISNKKLNPIIQKSIYQSLLETHQLSHTPPHRAKSKSRNQLVGQIAG